MILAQLRYLFHCWVYMLSSQHLGVQLGEQHSKTGKSTTVYLGCICGLTFFGTLPDWAKGRLELVQKLEGRCSSTSTTCASAPTAGPWPAP